MRRHPSLIAASQVSNSASKSFQRLIYNVDKCCFICENDGSERADTLTLTDQCSLCPTHLDTTKGQRILEHMAGHVLFDDSPRALSLIEREPCGFCLAPAPQCLLYFKRRRGKGTPLQVDHTKSTGCPLLCKFSYSVAATSTKSSPCSNVPIACQYCPPHAAAVWRYNFVQHMRRCHPNIKITAQHEEDAALAEGELEGLEVLWKKPTRAIGKRKCKPARGKGRGRDLDIKMALSEAHSSRLALR